MGYIGLALCSAILTSFVIIIVKYISKHIVKDSDVFLFWTYICALPFIIVIPLVHDLSFHPSYLIPIFFQSLFLTTGLYFFSKGVYLVDASVIGPMFQLQSGFIVLLATIFLGEIYSPAIYLYLALLIIGAMFVSVTDQTKLKAIFQKGVLLIIAMQLLHAGSNLFAGIALRHTTFWQVSFYSYLFDALLVSIYVYFKKVRVRLDFKSIKWFLLRSFFQVSGATLLYKAFETNLSISAAIGLLASPLVFVISLASARFFPDLLERQNRTTYIIRVVGMIIIIFAAWQINAHK